MERKSGVVKPERSNGLRPRRFAGALLSRLVMISLTSWSVLVIVVIKEMHQSIQPLVESNDMKPNKAVTAMMANGNARGK